MLFFHYGISSRRYIILKFMQIMCDCYEISMLINLLISTVICVPFINSQGRCCLNQGLNQFYLLFGNVCLNSNYLLVRSELTHAMTDIDQKSSEVLIKMLCIQLKCKLREEKINK